MGRLHALYGYVWYGTASASTGSRKASATRGKQPAACGCARLVRKVQEEEADDDDEARPEEEADDDDEARPGETAISTATGNWEVTARSVGVAVAVAYACADERRGIGFSGFCLIF
jgi:hypothetical protein